MKPKDIPQSVWDAAEKAYWPAVTGGSFTDDPWESIARAILAERDACRNIAIAHDAVSVALAIRERS